MCSEHRHGAGPANEVGGVFSWDSHQCAGDAARTRAAVCPPSSGCLNVASRHPDPNLFQGTWSTKPHPNSSSGPHCEILEISVKVSQGHAFSMLFNGKESWGTKVGMRSRNLRGKFELFFGVQTSFVFFVCLFSFKSSWRVGVWNGKAVIWVHWRSQRGSNHLFDFW